MVNLVTPVLLVLAATRASAQMVEYDLTVGKFQIECSKGSYCLFLEFDFPSFGYGPTNPPIVEEDRDRFSPYAGYYFADDGGRVEGMGCGFFKDSNSSCSATCDECTCIIDPTIVPLVDGNTTSFSLIQITPEDPNVVSCTVVSSLPDVSIYAPEELVTYQSSAQAPAYQSFRCSDEFASCKSVEESDSYFAMVTLWSEYYYAGDFQDCSGDLCYMACDPRCECQEINEDGQASDCIMGSPPTEAPTQMPTLMSTEDPTSGVVRASGMAVILLVIATLQV